MIVGVLYLRLYLGSSETANSHAPAAAMHSQLPTHYQRLGSSDIRAKVLKKNYLLA
jgi:hypothetical protein